ncbi:DUF305 domain-containing protein [Agrococcus jenensis]|uniref:Uncharacterized protein (DUF305 family) n=1 Tax=Agrococcus jenensis TaxID=46353 RepID=A0A3N2ARL3_9MICO|nr:DUF305 domain-containing protein [Agrococcus jenensis]ROR65352.1 uncharacterized protein (DUF305 family) [Agrococcus jenensis]
MKTINRALGVSALALAFVVTGCSAGGSTGTSPAASPGITEAPSSAAGSSEANAADEMFVTGMIPHHQQAIEMSEMVLEKDGLDPRVADLAERIRAAQAPEIEQLQGWLDEWGVEASADGGHGGHGAGGGMMSEDDMQALEDADGAEASTLFLQQMVAHHEGAVEMAEVEVADGQHPDVVALAQQMADAQSAEIAEMEQLLTEL